MEKGFEGGQSGNTGKIVSYTELIHSGGLGYYSKVSKNWLDLAYILKSESTEPTEHGEYTCSLSFCLFVSVCFAAYIF